MYGADTDPYVYPKTQVLKNSENIKDAEKLTAFEAEMFKLRADLNIPAGSFDSTHYKSIHKHLFQDVYDWAGEYRTVRIAKGGNWFCHPEYIDAHMTKLFQTLKRDNHLKGLKSEDFVKKAANFLAELNAIHPFRDGNGRTQLLFLNALAKTTEHPLIIENIKPHRFLTAMIESFAGKMKPLELEIKRLLV